MKGICKMKEIIYAIITIACFIGIGVMLAWRG
jgi:hypothetical protein